VLSVCLCLSVCLPVCEQVTHERVYGYQLNTVGIGQGLTL